MAIIRKTGKARIVAVQNSARKMAVNLLRIQGAKERQAAIESYFKRKPKDFKLASGEIVRRMINIADRVMRVQGQYEHSLLRTEQLEKGLQANSEAFDKARVLGEKGQTELIRMKIGLIATQGEIDAIVEQLEEVMEFSRKKDKGKIVSLIERARKLQAAHLGLQRQIEKKLRAV